MPIYRISETKMQIIKNICLPSEKFLQKLIESNLDNVFGIKFIESEYALPNGRIDTIGLDETLSPVVIEYKKRQDANAIIQGLFYVDWLKTNRRTFEMLVREKLGNDISVDWSIQPRLIIISEAYDIKEIAAVNQISANVELKKYSYYGDMLWIEDVKVNRIGTIRSGRNTEEQEAQETVSMDMQVDSAKSKVKEAFLNIRDWLLKYDENIEEIHKKTMICYYSNGKGLVWVELPSGKGIKLHLRKGNYKEVEKIKMNGWGGYPEITFKEDELSDSNIELIKNLIKQAHDN